MNNAKAIIKADSVELYRIICLDPVLFLETQKLYHSFFPGNKKKFVDVAKIIIVLNITTVKSYLYDFICAQGADELHDKITEAAVKTAQACAIASRFLAKERGLAPEKFSLYYAAGLFYKLEPLCNDMNFDNVEDKHLELAMCIATNNFSVRAEGLAAQLNLNKKICVSIQKLVKGVKRA